MKETMCVYITNRTPARPAQAAWMGRVVGARGTPGAGQGRWPSTVPAGLAAPARGSGLLSERGVRRRPSSLRMLSPASPVGGRGVPTLQACDPKSPFCADFRPPPQLACCAQRRPRRTLLQSHLREVSHARSRARLRTLR